MSDRKDKGKIVDTSHALKKGEFEDGDIATPGVLDEIRKKNPALYSKFFTLLAAGVVELFSIPATIEWYLLKLTLKSIALRNHQNPSETDVEVCAAGVYTRKPVASEDRDINYTLFRYYLSLGLRAAGSFIQYYGLNLLSDGRLAQYVQAELNRLSQYIK
ncbi:MAG: hypothetical protein KQA41_03350 [Candidatus Aenigmarchaeota archaeon]|nr:hypothetical protein [Candidatus Aenigmarchaeota archaeon]